MTPLDLILKTVSGFHHTDYTLAPLSAFYFAYRFHCIDYWNGSFFGRDSWKKDLFGHYFINSNSYSSIFVIGLIAIVTILLLLLLSLMLPVLSLSIMCYLFFL